MSRTIRVETFLPYPPDDVWRALTDSEVLAGWLMPNDFEPRIGHRFTFRTDPVPSEDFDGIVRCEVLDLAPVETLRISWSGGGIDTTITWRLVAADGGTRLLLVHDGFDEGDPRQQATWQMLAGGWSGHLVRRMQDAIDSMM